TTSTTTTTTESETTTTASETTTTPVASLLGDVNLDKKVSIADAVAILQYVANKDKYPLTAEAVDNADVYARGDGVTSRDALSIQKLDAGVIQTLPEV
ncbi:MAG: glycoside hydrolase, partial [Ruminococcus sp.]|nr:glycoside hydrolase [Ruminococcus sp.]